MEARRVLGALGFIGGGLVMAAGYWPLVDAGAPGALRALWDGTLVVVGLVVSVTGAYFLGQANREPKA